MSFTYHTLSSTDLENLTPATREEVLSYLNQRNGAWAPPRLNPPSPYNTLTIQPVPWPADLLEEAGGLQGTPPGSPTAPPVPSVPMARTDGPPRRRVILNPEEDDDEDDNEWNNQMELEACARQLLLQALPAVAPPPSSDRLKTLENTMTFIQMNYLEQNFLVAPRLGELRAAIADLRLTLTLINIGRPNHLGISI